MVEGRRDRMEALERYATFSRSHAWKFNSMLAVQRLVPRLPPPVAHAVVSAFRSRALTNWAFARYRTISTASSACSGSDAQGMRLNERQPASA